MQTATNNLRSAVLADTFGDHLRDDPTLIRLFNGVSIYAIPYTGATSGERNIFRRHAEDADIAMSDAERLCRDAGIEWGNVRRRKHNGYQAISPSFLGLNTDHYTIALRKWEWLLVKGLLISTKHRD